MQNRFLFLNRRQLVWEFCRLCAVGNMDIMGSLSLCLGSVGGPSRRRPRPVSTTHTHTHTAGLVRFAVSRNIVVAVVVVGPSCCACNNSRQQQEVGPIPSFPVNIVMCTRTHSRVLITNSARVYLFDYNWGWCALGSICFGRQLLEGAPRWAAGMRTNEAKLV